MRLKILIIYFLMPSILLAQNPAPEKKSTQPIYIYNVNLHIGNGQILNNGSILIENGKISKISQANNIQLPNNTTKIDGENKNVYPGIICPNTDLGLSEIESIRPTHDNNELGDYKPEVRALTSYNTDSEIIPTLRSNGVLICQATPIGGRIAGHSSIFNLDGWNWEDAVLKADDGLWIYWPTIYKKLTIEPDPDNKEIDSYIDKKNKLILFLQNAQKYANSNGTIKPDLQFEAVKNIFKQNAKLYINTSSAQEIIEAVNSCQHLNIKNFVIVGYEGISESISFLKNNNVAVLLHAPHRLPEYTESDVWEPYKLPKQLMDQGILVGLYYPESAWRIKNLIFAAGTASAFGLSKEQALQLITLNNAKILGIDNQVGTLEVGKNATFFICKGDVLDMRSSQVEKAYINGTEVNLDSKLKRLNKKYLEKYGIE